MNSALLSNQSICLIKQPKIISHQCTCYLLLKSEISMKFDNSLYNSKYTLTRTVVILLIVFQSNIYCNWIVGKWHNFFKFYFILFAFSFAKIALIQPVNLYRLIASIEMINQIYMQKSAKFAPNL